ncbi:MAG: FMN-binding glutamate synthase family protein [Acidimicrobiales bacterium]|nr:FMN-binding glutamate synthase family protein [Acidimicrobiales bacterium]RZV48069.1 MAG: FMN-binding glutamate synthase family protein [Acidimicrobiales bacterium]
MPWWLWVLIVVLVLLVLLTIYDLTQKKHAILRNFPVIGHFRYILEKVGPELRQYIVTDNDEERPFSRNERRFVYSSAKKENSYFGFGTDSDLLEPGYIHFRHAAFPHPSPPKTEADDLPMLKVLGGAHNRARAFTPQSLVYISAMSYGSLSAPAIEAINRGSKIAGCLHNTGEGGISDHHKHGGPLIFQIGTGYFGARNPDGTFSMDRLLESIDGVDVQAIELKLSQGAKPGLGGVLPAAKVTPEIARVRGVEVGVTVNSPAQHRSFDDVAGLVSFVEEIAQETGLPVGIKSAVGQLAFWNELAHEMRSRDAGPDFVTIDGGEGGTGAAPLPFSDHVAMPFREGFASVYRAFADRSIHNDVVFLGAGHLGLPTEAQVALSMGVDGIGVAREAMLAVGCIQAQKCHNGHCPTGVATQNPRLTRGLDPTDKSVRLANYVATLRHELVRLANAMGVDHPGRIPHEAVEIRLSATETTTVRELYDYDPRW